MITLIRWGFPLAALDNSHQIHVVIVGGHAVLLVEELILAAVVSYVYKDKQILAADGALDKSLGVAGLETRALGTRSCNHRGACRYGLPISRGNC